MNNVASELSAKLDQTGFACLESSSGGEEEVQAHGAYVHLVTPLRFVP